MHQSISPIAAQHTLNWLRSFIIEYNLCPFAKGPVNKETLRIQVSETRKKAQALEDLMLEIQLLDNQSEIETTLLVFTESFKDFFAYLDFVDLAERLIVEQGYEGIYQLATFHPGYYFADTDPEDVSNYSNRSPYPMIHILREEALEKAISSYGNTELIPEKNIETLNQLGIAKIKKILEQI
jgi:hypothetical protein